MFELLLYIIFAVVFAGWLLIFSAFAWEIKMGLRRKKRRKQFKRFALSEEDKRIIHAAYNRRFRDEQGRD